LLEYSAKIPPLLKFKKRRTKYLLKSLSEKYLPKSLLYTEKRGFGVPVDLWMQQNLSNIFENVLFNPLALERNYFNMPFIKQMWQEHQTKKFNHKHRLWALFWFELWHLMFIDEVTSRNTPLSEVPSMIASL
jgi:asparagine synthase (glutamine-hydrolysing)